MFSFEAHYVTEDITGNANANLYKCTMYMVYIYICMCKVCVTGRFAHICSKFRLFPWDWSQTNWAGFNPPHLSNAHSKTFSKEQLHSEKDYSSSEHVFFGCWISLYYSFLSQGMMMFSYSQIFSKDTFQTYISLQHYMFWLLPCSRVSQTGLAWWQALKGVWENFIMLIWFPQYDTKYKHSWYKYKMQPRIYFMPIWYSQCKI